jgi:hypothetical protein
MDVTLLEWDNVVVDLPAEFTADVPVVPPNPLPPGYVAPPELLRNKIVSVTFVSDWPTVPAITLRVREPELIEQYGDVYADGETLDRCPLIDMTSTYWKYEGPVSIRGIVNGDELFKKSIKFTNPDNSIGSAVGGPSVLPSDAGLHRFNAPERQIAIIDVTINYLRGPSTSHTLLIKYNWELQNRALAIKAQQPVSIPPPST